MNRFFSIVASVFGTTFLFVAFAAQADDGGQNMLLVVNPNDENALRIANAYAQDRDIPTNNIVYIAPPSVDGYTDGLITFSQFTSTYVDQLPSIITQRGLGSQIDYIATLGQPTQVSSPDPTSSATTTMSLNYGLSMLTQFQRGMSMNAALLRPSELSQAPFVTNTFNYTPGANTAIHHSNQLAVGVTTPNPDPEAGYPVPGPSTAPPGYNTVQWYMSGTVGYYGMNGTDTTQQIINNLASSVAADGTKPSGPVYFEANNDIRTTVYGQPFWGPVQHYMTANGIPWVQESNQTGNSPYNQSNVPRRGNRQRQRGVAQWFDVWRRFVRFQRNKRRGGLPGQRSNQGGPVYRLWRKCHQRHRDRALPLSRAIPQRGCQRIQQRRLDSGRGVFQSDSHPRPANVRRRPTLRNPTLTSPKSRSPLRRPWAARCRALSASRPAPV